MRDTPCPGCLASKKCWVCLGTGAANTYAQSGVCLSCRGTGRCRYCCAAPDPALTIDVTDRSSTATARVERHLSLLGAPAASRA